MTGSRSARGPDAQFVEGSPSEPTFTSVVVDLLRRGVRVRFRASGSSMAPAIVDGDAITVEPVAPTQLRRGDVLLVRRGEGVVAHRAVGRRRNRDSAPELVLRGDAADGDDAPVPPTDVLGRVVEVDRDGARTRPSSWVARQVALLRSIVRSLRRPDGP